MSELVMTIKADKESLDMAMHELQIAIGKYPKIADTVLKDINRYLVMNTIQTDEDECYIRVSVSDDLYSLIELVYNVKIIEFTRHDSKHREFMEVSNER